MITETKPTPGPTQPPIQVVPGTMILEVKQAGPEDEYSYLVKRLKIVELYLHSPLRVHGIVLNYTVKNMDKFRYYCYYCYYYCVLII
jgi:hypothetical protein